MEAVERTTSKVAGEEASFREAVKRIKYKGAGD
jgi:hypothetical protein